MVWTVGEEKQFYLALQKYGVGRWAEIRDELNTVRTNVHLKDKWRSMKKNYKELSKEYGPIDVD